MARARNIKPAFFTNELLGTEDPMVSLTFIGLWCLADKVGVLEDRPLRIKAELFPYRDSLDINGYLTVLARLGFIVRYENDGRRFIQVCNFRKHQSPHNTEKGKGFPFSTDPKSLILADNGYETVKPRCLYGESLVPERPDSLIPDTGFTDSLIPDSLIPDSKNKIKNTCAASPHAELFSRFWSLYPNRKGKADAEKSWAKLKPTDELFAQICEGLAKQVTCYEWTKDGGKFIPHPATWLNGKRWTDEVKLETKPLSVHGGFDDRDYNDGLITREDGSLGL